MQFYDVRTKSKVDVDESKLTKKKYARTTKSGSTQVRYALRANHNGSNLTRFVSEADYNSTNVPEEN